jgi:adenylosuccinate lyase
MREQGIERNDLLDRLAADTRIPLGRTELDALFADRLSFTGVASSQVAEVAGWVAEIAARYPQAADYTPEPIL